MPQNTVTYDIKQLGLSAGEHTIAISFSALGYVDSDITELSITAYSITTNLTHCTMSGLPTATFLNDSFSGIITPTTGAYLPIYASQITVTNATLSNYNRDTGAYTISNVLGNVTITINCEEVTYDYEQVGEELYIHNALYTQDGGVLTIA